MSTPLIFMGYAFVCAGPMEWPCRYGARLAEHASNNKAGETLRAVWVILASAG
ncbi:hypothetical protein [Erythrobacter sp. A6_0]|uniref:hypothetical protein n=1 Tax=Erythrobacter sp. A6_0 TaxID=2821089 RepID=UPI001ADB9476|nr:hypothetical protein [Erythrobacter sp. A6_0]MBO9510797.1 hypothetical protein [Erythrobacter sp. A6_0]